MITHNGKYLGAATHHGMPIYAATMGGKMVFGIKWRLQLTTQAILVAFGAEGTEVIRKTNDYLNRIATTDLQRAQALANFINEDPLLVCSLVETSKVRTGIIWNAKYGHDDNGIVFPFIWSEVGSMDMNITSDNNNCIFICGATSLTDAMASKNGYCTFGGTNALGVTVTRSGTWTLNTLSQVGMTFATNTKKEYVRIGGWNYTVYGRDLWINYWNIYDTAGDPFVKLVPYLTTDGEVCFLDLVNLQLHHNVYTDPFTIAITPKTTS